MSWLKRFFGIFPLAFLLISCASGTEINEQRRSEYFPGGLPDYAWGVSQREENFNNIERAQSYSGIYPNVRSWQKIGINTQASARIIGLNSYYPLSVRWRLKDGREYIVERIDLEAIMRDYFADHKIVLPWQRENRSRDIVGDYVPILAHEIIDDFVHVKWVVRINRTPVAQRLTKTGAATAWNVIQEEYLVAKIKGVPVANIDFDKLHETGK